MRLFRERAEARISELVTCRAELEIQFTAQAKENCEALCSLRMKAAATVRARDTRIASLDDLVASVVARNRELAAGLAARSEVMPR